ncbi:MAG: hypothetical protein Q9159_000419 [Coniocarpon cinnabarinum]
MDENSNLSKSSTGSPDPLALTIEGGRDPLSAPSKAPREKPANKSPSIKTTPSKQTQQVVFTTPGKQSSTKEVSPWRIRVTVEAETDQHETMSSPSPSKVRTTKVPLNDIVKSTAAKGTPKRRGRPRESDSHVAGEKDQDSDVIVKNLRRSLPARRDRRQSGLVNEILPEDVREEAQDAGQTPAEPPKRKRGRPRKSDVGVASTPTVESASRPSPKKRKLKPFRDSSPVTPDSSQDLRSSSQAREQSVEGSELGSEVGAQSTHDSLQGEDAASYASEEPEGMTLVDVRETTADLDRSAVESEGFSIVSLESLRSQRERADHRMPAATTPNDHSDSVRPMSDHAQHSTASSPATDHLEPRGRSAVRDSAVEYLSLPRHLDASQTSQRHANVASQRVTPQMKALHKQSSLFTAYSDQTRRELRQSLLTGEQLAQDVASPPLNALQKSLLETGADVNGRLPTPADSVESPGRTVEYYEPMSWRAEAPSTNAPGLSAQQSPADIWRDEADRSLDDSLDVPRQRQRTRAQTEMPPPQNKRLSQPVELEPLPVKRLQQSAQQSSKTNQDSQKPSVVPFDNTSQVSPVPSLSDLLPVDDRPPRGKLPRTWRRASNNDFLYSDESSVHDSPSPQMSVKKPALHSPGVMMTPKYPSLFHRLGLVSQANTAGVSDQTRADGIDRSAEKGTAGNVETESDNSDQSNYRPQTPPLDAQPCKSILSSPYRRSVSPVKSVTWRGDDSLEETRVDSTEYVDQYSSQLAEHDVTTTRTYDKQGEGPDDDDSDDEDVHHAITTDDGGAHRSSRTSLGSHNFDDSNLADGEETLDATELVSSPLNAKAPSQRFARGTAVTPVSNSTFSLPESAPSDDTDIPIHATAMSHQASARKPQLPNTSLPNEKHNNSQGILSRISSLFFGASVSTTVDPKAPQPGPHVWTYQHQLLLNQLFVYLPCLRPDIPFTYNPRAEDYHLNLIQPLPQNTRVLPLAFFVHLDQIPTDLTREIGKTYQTIPHCDRGPTCGPNCPGVPWWLRLRIYSHTITQTDVRLAFALNVLFKFKGMPVYDGPTWQPAERKKVLRDASGAVMIRKEDWDTPKLRKRLLWNVFGGWVQRQMDADEGRATIGDAELREMMEKEDENDRVARLWRERDYFGF